MVSRYMRLFVILACLLLALAGGSASADDGQDAGLPGELVPPPNESLPSDGDDTEVTEDTPDPYSDQDGMLPGEQDPDDDDDGVQDTDDSHPNDPTKGEKPAPGPTDPIADDDGDGLPNVMDPDDNQNGIPDADEGVGTTGDDVPAKSKHPVTNADSPAPTGGGTSAPASTRNSLVLALPSTGSGTRVADPAAPVLVIGVAILLATSSFTIRKHRM